MDALSPTENQASSHDRPPLPTSEYVTCHYRHRARFRARAPSEVNP
jgi:hypothetical protein